MRQVLGLIDEFDALAGYRTVAGRMKDVALPDGCFQA
jgi:hypothetical protein